MKIDKAIDYVKEYKEHGMSFSMGEFLQILESIKQEGQAHPVILMTQDEYQVIMNIQYEDTLTALELHKSHAFRFGPYDEQGVGWGSGDAMFETLNEEEFLTAFQHPEWIAIEDSLTTYQGLKQGGTT